MSSKATGLDDLKIANHSHYLMDGSGRGFLSSACCIRATGVGASEVVADMAVWRSSRGTAPLVASAMMPRAETQASRPAGLRPAIGHGVGARQASAAFFRHWSAGW